MFHVSNTNIDCSLGDISNHLLKLTTSSAPDLESDLENLLILHNSWKKKDEKDGVNNYQLALISLKQDIYFVFEWLCGLGYEESDLFAKWQYKDQQPSSWSQLKDVLDFEEIHFPETFENYVGFYTRDISKYLPQIDITESYKRLQKCNSFDPWIRAFCDLHADINREKPIIFVQPRVIDRLLLMSIRTEILLREISSKILGNKDSDDFKDVIRDIAKIVEDDQGRKVLETIRDNKFWKLTLLHERPDNIFHQVEVCQVGKLWSNSQKFFFKSILNFVVSRNYFAHHYYKDDELNNQASPLSEKVLVACISSVLYIDNLVQKKYP